MFEETGRFHRQPVGFGPAPTPRQDPNGNRFDWSKSEAHLTGVVFDVEREGINALLPDGYEVDPSAEQPTVLFEVMNLRNLPWLAGRGYNTWGVYASDVICSRSEEPIKASYQLVLFENLAEPIITGREELGFAKVFADLGGPHLESGKLVHSASSFGTEFMRLEIPDLAFRPISEAPALSSSTRPYTMPSVNGILSHRYVPAVGKPGQHDASYAVYMPGRGSSKPTILHYATTTANLNDLKLTITAQPFEKLPTLWSISEGLATLKLGDVREVYHQIEAGAGDCGGTKRVEF